MEEKNLSKGAKSKLGGGKMKLLLGVREKMQDKKRQKEEGKKRSPVCLRVHGLGRFNSRGQV